jgi:hypothetical protein
MSRQSLRAALVRLTSFETTPPYDAVVDVGRELNDVRMDDFAGSYPLSPARGLLYAAARLTHPRLTEADRARWNDGGHIIGLLRQWDGNELWPYDRNQLIAFARDADAELERRTPLANIAAEGGVVGGQDHAVVPAVVLPRKPEFNDILRVIWQTGTRMERLPHTYRGMNEEALRDHFITTLSPPFPSTTGETFNKKGKTDILIQHEGQNVFIAECKYWRGAKGHHETIDQLLGYLTWRDSVAAVVCFVDNNQLTPVLATIEKESPTHTSFVKSHGKKEEGWFMYEFHLPSDPGRIVELAVLVFHFPPP